MNLILAAPSPVIMTPGHLLPNREKIVHKKIEPDTQSPARQSLIQSFWDTLHFLVRYVQNPTTVGSLTPSSVFLARKIVHYIPTHDDDQPRHYLEVGAGTGPFTAELIPRMKRDDRLDIVEFDPKFCEILKKKFSSANVQVHCVPIEQWQPGYKYDAIVSGLPLNLFSPEMVEKILATFKRLTKERGKISYFEYLGLPSIKAAFLTGSTKQNFQRVLDIKELFFKTYGIKKDTVIMNFPPARVLHLQMP